MTGERGRKLRVGRHETDYWSLVTCLSFVLCLLQDLWEAWDSAQACPTAVLFFLLAGPRDTQSFHEGVRVSPLLGRGLRIIRQGLKEGGCQWKERLGGAQYYELRSWSG